MFIATINLIYFLLLILFFLVTCITWKIYIKLRIKPINSYTCMFKKVVIITGANSGLGFETALELSKRGAKIILACRNATKAQRAVKNIIYQTENKNVFHKHLDLASFSSIRNFVKEIYENEKKIDVLINNAGIGGIDDQLTEDGHLTMIQVNYLGHFLLTNLLIDKLKESPGSRIINLTSNLAKRSDLNLKNFTNYPYFKQNYFARKSMYSNSKLCMIYFTQEISRKLCCHGITVNAVHPGAILTGVWDIPELFKNIIKLIGFYFFKTVEEGSRTIIYLATSQDVKNVTGGLFENCAEIKMYKTARNPNLGIELWELSEKLVNLYKKKIM
ncbi:retinol dehydrogenase 14-like [Onthophagus taurus]|uniref:retinol dehydrogenase 14-like n=1 Tax=Onthophagus taurus TaxID=166361 RepID=UPI0039BE8897